MKYELSSNLNLMCLKSLKGPLTAEQTFDLLENNLSTLKKKKFYGLSKLENNKLTYLACVKIEDGDNINAPRTPGSRFTKRKICQRKNCRLEEKPGSDTVNHR